MQFKSFICLLLVSCSLTAQAFVNYESPAVHPVRISPDGSRLFAVSTADNRLVVWSLTNPTEPVILKEIPVGLEPVSVTPRNNDEVWVVNHLSDSVSIVSVSEGRAIDTLRVKDEPTDVAFAGGKAFVTATASDEVHVFDASTRAGLGTIPIFGKDPRGLAASGDGTKVYALVNRSGNRTTLLPMTQAPPPPLPTNPALPPAPQSGLVVSLDDPAWSGSFAYDLPDNDIAEIDVQTLSVMRYFTGVGTTNFDLTVHSQTNEIFVVNTDARNAIRFEPVLRGHCIDSRLTRITTGSTPTVDAYDLNPGIDYNTLPNPAARATALSEPTGVVLDESQGLLYVAAQGTDRIGVVSTSGTVIARIEIGNTPGATVNSVDKRGPRGLALHPTAPILYVFNRLTNTLTLIDKMSYAVLSETPIGTHDPTPSPMKIGRRFLYDAKLSGNGTMSCASCHVDGDTDGLAWDLGDPGGNMSPAPTGQPFPFSQFLADLHPMKGPMTTQTLKGLAGVGPLHWRGDRPNFASFNGAFDVLMGGQQLSPSDMQLFAQFGTSISFPPNPNQPLSRSYETLPASTNQATGFDTFVNTVVSLPQLGSAFACATCHALPSTTSGFIVATPPSIGFQQLKVPQLRNLYRKVGFVDAAGPQKSGFGFEHDGGTDTLSHFLSTGLFPAWPSQLMDDVEEFLMAVDTGTAPTVGFQVKADQSNWSGPALADWLLLRGRAIAGDVDVVAQGVIDDEVRGLLFDPVTNTFLTDRAGAAPFTLLDLESHFAAGTAELTFMGVPPGSGARMGIDRDEDGVLDGDEGVSRYGSGTPGCAGTPRISANSSPGVGNEAFAIVFEDAPASGVGFFGFSLSPASMPISGMTLLVDVFTAASIALPISADPSGTSFWSAPIPGVAALAGATFFGQVAWFDACAPGGVSASRGIKIVIQP